MVINIFSYTADSVSAHGPFASVRIVHNHAAVRLIGRSNQNQAIGTNAGTPGTYDPCHAGRIRNLLLKGIYIYIIIADAMHLCKLHPVSFLP